MRTVCDWFLGEGSRALLDGDDDGFLLELRRRLSGAVVVVDGTELHARLLAKVSSLLPELAREARIGPECMGLAERIAATSETPENVSRVILRALTCRSAKIRRRAMVHAKDHPHSSLVDALLRIVDHEPANRSLAMTALAHHEQAEAQQCLFDFAANEDARQQDRVLAITLLSVHRPDGTLELLIDLSKHRDDGIRAASKQVLRSWNE